MLSISQNLIVACSLLYLHYCQLILPVLDSSSPCYRYQCQIGKACQVINGKPICKCNHHCIKSRSTGPLCASNGQTYDSLCHLKKEECKVGKYLIVKYYGNCSRVAPCHDRKRETELNLCRDWAAFGACSNHKSLMKKYCPKTCDMCEGSVETKTCAQTAYGCCEGSPLPALGPKNEGCQAGCRDGRQCKFFPNFCGDKRNINTMNKYCSFTCRYCAPTNGSTVKLLSGSNYK